MYAQDYGYNEAELNDNQNEQTGSWKRHGKRLAVSAALLSGSLGLITAGQASAGECTDTDGDGYGWDGIETCTPTDNNTDTISPAEFQHVGYEETEVFEGSSVGSESPAGTTSENTSTSPDLVDPSASTQAPLCTNSDTDHDGDGWGWTGTQSCIVPSQNSGDEAETVTVEENAPDKIFEIDVASNGVQVTAQNINQRAACIDLNDGLDRLQACLPPALVNQDLLGGPEQIAQDNAALNKKNWQIAKEIHREQRTTDNNTARVQALGIHNDSEGDLNNKPLDQPTEFQQARSDLHSAWNNEFDTFEKWLEEESQLITAQQKLGDATSELSTSDQSRVAHWESRVALYESKVAKFEVDFEEIDKQYQEMKPELTAAFELHQALHQVLDAS